MVYSWAITGTGNATIDSNGKVTFNDHAAGTYVVTCTDGDHCGKFTITRSGKGCEQPPTRLKITLTVTENDTMRGYALSDADLKYNNGKDGYRVHRSSDGTSEEVIATNVSVVASKLGVSQPQPIEFCPDPYKTCAYYGCPGGDNKWTVYNGDNIDNNKLKSFFEGAWKCTAENKNWKAAEHQPCKGTYVTDVFTVEIINKSNTYNLPYSGRIKLNLTNNTSINLYYRNCSNTDSQTWPHFYYGRNNEDGQCTNFIVPHGSSVTLACRADASVASLTASIINSVEIYAAIINNTPEHNQELDCIGHASYLQSRGFKLGDVSVEITRT